jgi:muramoyltetrapeptide carboxypeptidase
MSIRPPRIGPGSRLGVAAPAGPCYDWDRVEKGIDSLKSMGFEVELGRTLYQRRGYLAGDDYERAWDINYFFSRRDIDGIVCLRGGYGTLRILNRIDYCIIRNNPKVFVGYSDITALHNAISRKCDMITFHGPMVAVDFAMGIDEYTRTCFLRLTSSPEPPGVMINPDGYGSMKPLLSGWAQGKITGGNLSVIASAIGTPYEIDTRGKLLFLEDVGEEPYRIDRMLTQLLHGGILQRCSGIVLGQWTDCTAEEPERSFSLMEVFADRLKPIGIPVIYNAASGHDKIKMTIPLGAEARITPEGELIILEGCVL